MRPSRHSGYLGQNTEQSMPALVTQQSLQSQRSCRNRNSWILDWAKMRVLYSLHPAMLSSLGLPKVTEKEWHWHNVVNLPSRNWATWSRELLWPIGLPSTALQHCPARCTHTGNPTARSCKIKQAARQPNFQLHMHFGLRGKHGVGVLLGPAVQSWVAFLCKATPDLHASTDTWVPPYIAYRARKYFGSLV